MQGCERIIACLMLLACHAVTVSAQEKYAEDLQANPALSTSGTDFWIAIPPNDINNSSSNALEIYIASEFDANISVYEALGDRTFTYTVRAGKVLTLSSTRQETSWAWEIGEFERAVRKGIRIVSDRPITVYVLNAKQTSSEGYLAIPTRMWGTEYIVSTYSDFNEQKPWAGGFCVVASENNTSVTIALRGEGKGLATTSGGRNIGDTIRTILNEGDVFAVIGNGKTRSEFDLTGTSILSSKPIGVFGFHQRSSVPNLLINGNGRNHLVEMTPPVNRWGKKYVSVEFNRQSTNSQGRGDLFRVVSSRADTKFSYSYFNKDSKEFVGSGGGVLAAAGEFIDVTSTSVPAILPYGYSVWESDKPILVTQMSTSATFDGDDQHDPFMIHVTPLSHATTSTLFQTPTAPQFFRHNLNLIVWVDMSSPQAEEHLRSINLNGVPLHSHPDHVGSPLLTNHMGGGVHWVTVSLPTDVSSHRISGDGAARFIGYVYGYGNVDSYGWPLGYGSANNASSIDTMLPVVIRQQATPEQSLYTVEFATYEIRNIPNPPRVVPLPRDQVESGIGLIYLKGTAQSNLKLILHTDSRFPSDNPHTAFRFAVRTIDTSLQGTGTIVVRDLAGNEALYPITIDAPIRATPSSADFGMTILESRPTKIIRVRNPTPFPVEVTNVRLKRGDHYSALSNRPLPIILDSNESIDVVLTYFATRETSNYRTDWDVDTVMIFSPLIDVRVPVRGVAGIPYCVVENYPFGVIQAGGQKCIDFNVRNSGSFPLLVNGVSGFDDTDFDFIQAPDALDEPVEPNKIRTLGLACYVPKLDGHDTARIVVSVNYTKGNDTVSTWFGSTRGASVVEGGDGAAPFVLEDLGNERLRLVLTPGIDGVVSIVDLKGAVVFQTTLGTMNGIVEFSSREWPVGTYVVAVNHGSEEHSRTIQVVR